MSDTENPVPQAGDSNFEDSSLVMAELKKDLPPQLQEIIENDPESKRAILRIFEAYSGAIPHPRHIKAYEETVPGSAKAIIEDFTKWGDTGREIEKRKMAVIEKHENDEYQLNIRGQNFAIVSYCLPIGLCVALIALGKPVEAVALFGVTTIATVVREFLQRGKANITTEKTDKESDTDASKK